MITLSHLSKGFRRTDGYFPVIDDVTLSLPTGKSLALLGGNGAGKSTLLHLIAGTLRPDSGSVQVSGSISWPIGFNGSFHRDLTGEQNTRFLARVYGVDTGDLSDFVADFAELGPQYFEPLHSYSSGMRARLSFAVSMGIPFQTYLVDEVTAVGDARFKRKSKALFRDRMARADTILVSHSEDDLRQVCNAALVLRGGRLRYFDDVTEALKHYRKSMA